jgi:hypothetical protein
VKKLIGLAFVCGFLFVLVGCSDTKSTGSKGTGTSSAPAKAPDKSTKP